MLDAVNIFPIPWKINSGDAIFDAVRLSFTNLPADGEIKLYTILGEKLRTLHADAAGLAFWDGKNHNEFKVGSGTYIAVITGGGGRKVRRVLIVR